MRVPRSSLMALAALLTGTLASAAASGTETAALGTAPTPAPVATQTAPDPAPAALAAGVPRARPELEARRGSDSSDARSLGS